MKYLHGIRVPHKKETANRPTVRMAPPATVSIPMLMHIGAPAAPIVKAGDLVAVGTKIGEAAEGLSSPVYSSVSGKVTGLTELPLADGTKTTAVVIASDGLMTPCDTLRLPLVDSREGLVSAMRESGIVGLGGAGFPTYYKWDVDPDRVEILVVNGAECEPYITSDTVTMLERSGDMAFAIHTLATYFGLKKVIIGVEAHNKKAVAAMRALADRDNVIEVQVLPDVYPQGGEKVLVYHTTGRVIPVGKLPIDVGVIVNNCTTLAALGAYLRTGMPLVEKCVTVGGGAVREPKNLIVPIGTSLDDVFEAAGGLSVEPREVLYGGPMMGVGLPNRALPVLKNTNAALALTEKESRLPKTAACIRCGSCTNTCPFGLSPVSIAAAYRKKDTEALEALSVNACMECGCCSFVCPANRPLVQTNKLSKALLKETKAKEEKNHG